MWSYAEAPPEQVTPAAGEVLETEDCRAKQRRTVENAAIPAETLLAGAQHGFDGRK